MNKITSQKKVISQADYQPHIDGIRAIAVSAVMLFHANSSWLPGGFVGVDIFFVISGYLISGVILRQQLSGSFSLFDFYIRRIRRIFPALLVVIIFSFAFAWVLLLPDEMRSFTKSIFSSVLMYSNQQFLSEAGYFENQSHLKPLLHTWSLSIEGQFYLIFPLVLVATIKLTKRPIYFVALLMFISFFYAEKVSHIDSEKSFFYFLARAWELLAGCLVMFMVSQTNKRHLLMDQLLSIAGLCCVTYAILFFDKSMLHPGALTLLPIIGTALLITFSSETTIAGKLLKSRIMVGIGLVSYSLYLWHQPIISFSKIHESNLNLAAWLCIFSLIFSLSVLTYKLVEKPFRNRNYVSNKQFLLLMCSFSLMMCFVGLFGYQSNGFIHERFSKEKINLIKSLDAERYKYFLFKHLYANDLIRKKYQKDNKPKLLIVGDSYAADFMNMVVSNNYLNKYQVRTLYVPARCQFYIGDNNYLALIDRKDSALCEQTQKKLSALKRHINTFDQVIFVFDWKLWIAEHLRKSIDALALRDNNKRFIFIGTKRFIVNKREIIQRPIDQISNLSSARDERIIHINRTLAEQAKPHIFIDQDELFCGENNRCPLFTDQSKPISIDGQHLTQEGAMYLGKVLFAHPDLTKLNERVE